MKTAIQAAVLYALARHASDKTATAWPSVSTICAETLYSERGVRLALADLVKAGVLVRTDRKAPNGRSTSSCYRIAAGGLDGPICSAEGAQDAPCADVTVHTVQGEGAQDAPYEGAQDAPSSLNRSEVNRPGEPNEVCVNPVVVDRAREPEPTHTHKPETYLEAFARRMRAEQARQAEELAQYLAENPEPPPPPPAPPPAPYWGGDRRAADDDGWGPVDQTPAKPEQAKHDLADIPELEELVNASKPAKLRRLSLGDVEARVLVELVEKHGAEAVRAALLGLAGEYERPLQPVRKHLEAAAAAPAIPRHPNGQPMWVVERDGYKRMLSPSGAPW